MDKDIDKILIFKLHTYSDFSKNTYDIFQGLYIEGSKNWNTGNVFAYEVLLLCTGCR